MGNGIRGVWYRIVKTRGQEARSRMTLPITRISANKIEPENLRWGWRIKLRYKSKQEGFVLLTTLLFTTLLTMITVSIVESSLLVSKVSNYYGEAFIAFYRAERALAQSEAALLRGEVVGNFKKIESECGVDYYLGVARGVYKDAVVNLQSTVAVVDSAVHCDLPPKVNRSGRQSWLMM